MQVDGASSQRLRGSGAVPDDPASGLGPSAAGCQELTVEDPLPPRAAEQCMGPWGARSDTLSGVAQLCSHARDITPIKCSIACVWFPILPTLKKTTFYQHLQEKKAH